MPDVVVDAHHHLWVRARTPQPWIDPVTMAAIDADFMTEDLPASAHGVTATVVVQSADLWAETDELIAVAASDAGRAAGIAGVVGWADLFAPDLAERLAALRAGSGSGGLVGVRTQVQAEADPGYLDRADVRAGIATVGAAGLVFDLVIRHDQVAACAALAAALPDVRFVLDHLGKPPLAAAVADPGALDTWRRDLAALAVCPNVTAKVSGLVTEADWDRWRPADLRPAVEHALDVFGPSRLMFGSDWPVSLLAIDYGMWLEVVHELLSDLAADERADVLAGTAARTYSLDLPAFVQPTTTHPTEEPLP